jgi:putative ABC transport system permease protein
VSAEQLGNSRFEVSAVPLSGLAAANLDSALFGSASGSVSVTTLLLALGVLVLAVACINYANLATARAVGRARDVGLRKVVGASRSQLATQYLIESGASVVVALGLAIVLLSLVAPVLDTFADIDITQTVLPSAEFVIFLGILPIAVTLIAGIYPAVVLSGVRPLDALRLGRLRSGPRRLSRVLVGIQFLVAGFLLISVIVMYSQNFELRRSGLGLAEDPLLVIDNASALSGVSNETFREELLQLPQITAVTEMATVPWGPGLSLLTVARSPGADAAGRSVFSNFVGYDFFSMFGIETLAGRVFDREHDDVMPEREDRSADRPFHVVIDLTLVEQLGFETPSAAVDQIIYFPVNPSFGVDTAQPLRIIGVVEDRPMHLRGAGATSNFFLLGQDLEQQVARVSSADVSGALAAIDALWARISPSTSRSYRFLDEIFDESYQTFSRVNQAFATLAFVALFISMIGLLGMAVQITNRRVHEIGVRKTLGASTGQVVRMLLLDIGKPVLIANVIAWPLGYVAAQAYLSIFMHRIIVTPAPFLLTLLFTVLIAVLAVGGQALRAARVRPAEVLNSE